MSQGNKIFTLEIVETGNSSMPYEFNVDYERADVWRIVGLLSQLVSGMSQEFAVGLIRQSKRARGF